MGAAFSGLVSLEELVITSLSCYNVSTTSSLRSRTEKDNSGLPSFLSERIAAPDPNLPELRDLRKLVRRLPCLHCIRWTGRGGKGEWHFSKRSNLVDVEFIHSAVLMRATWDECQHRPPYSAFEEPATPGTNVLELPATPSSLRSREITSPSQAAPTTGSSRRTAQTSVPSSPRTPASVRSRQSGSSAVIPSSTERATGLGLDIKIKQTPWVGNSFEEVPNTPYDRRPHGRVFSNPNGSVPRGTPSGSSTTSPQIMKDSGRENRDNSVPIERSASGSKSRSLGTEAHLHGHVDAGTKGNPTSGHQIAAPGIPNSAQKTSKLQDAARSTSTSILPSQAQVDDRIKMSGDTDSSPVKADVSGRRGKKSGKK